MLQIDSDQALRPDDRRIIAQPISRCTPAEKERSCRRIVVGLTLLRSLIGTCLLIALISIPARADEDERGAPGKIEALEAKVTSLQATVSALQEQISSLRTVLSTVQSNPALALGPYVTVDPTAQFGVVGPHITFKGANIHIVSGSGFTNDNDNPSGLGNLIIGYDEPPGELNSTDRGGSHNLVIGRYNRFTETAFGGLVAGELNIISNKEASVSGGANNTASGLFASVSGGVSNTASGGQASVSGGVNNAASGSGSSVSGGEANTASRSGASVSGGMSNTASGSQATVSGGDGNTANGPQSSISGGAGNTADGSAMAIIGGQNVNDRMDGSIRPQPPFNP
jgi:trimeric autotransporter adhesin